MKNLFLLLILILAVPVYIVLEIFVAESPLQEKTSFVLGRNEDTGAFIKKLKQEKLIDNEWIFKKYLIARGIDKRLRSGTYEVEPPITMNKVAGALLQQNNFKEKEITIIPGWDLRDLAEYFLKLGLIQKEEDLYKITGEPGKTETEMEKITASILKQKPKNLSLEGYLAPNTYRVFDNATALEVIEKIVGQREEDLQNLMGKIKSSGHDLHTILTMASILEKEVRGSIDRRMVADIFWRRVEYGWLLQADSTTHYAVGKKGNLFTTKNDRENDNPWNTYKYKRLPPGPICNPSLNSIEAALSPEKNDYWYFLTTLEGEVKYSKTLEEHNSKVWKYLR